MPDLTASEHQFRRSHPLRQDAPDGRLGLLPRAQARLRAGALDRLLADGADPDASPALALRAAKLASPRFRRKLAGALEAAGRAAEGPGFAFSAAVPVARVEVRDACLALAALSETLRSENPVGARGVAMARLLIVDSTSPLYSTAAEPGELDRAVRAAADALELRQ